MDIQPYGSNPGLSTLVQTTEAFIWSGREGHTLPAMMGIVSTALDTGSSPTSLLRAGLVMGKIASTGLLKEYDKASVDGSEVAFCVLIGAHSVLDQTGAAATRNGHVMLTGCLHAASLLNLDATARRQLIGSGRFFFDDNAAYGGAFGGLMQREAPLTAQQISDDAVTVVAADVGKLFTTLGGDGALVYTLPALAPGLGPYEFLNRVNQNMTIASAAGNDIVALNDLLASSIGFSTTNEKIGARVQFCANQAGDRWYWRQFGGGTVTVL